MRHDYIIYPQAEEKLKSAGLLKKIKEAHKSGKISIGGHMFDDDVVSCFKEMSKYRMFKRIPEQERKEFQNKLDNAWKNTDKKDSGYWTVKRKSAEVKENIEVEDFPLMAGWQSYLVLPKNDVFSYKKFGFPSLTAFTGAMGAAVERELHDSGFRDGLKWKSKSLDGKTLINEIGGDFNCDLRIHQVDVTPYETIDPLGNQVEFRPEFDEDRGGVYAYHSTESEFLIAVLKYADNLKLTPDSLKNNAKETIAWVKSLGQGGGTCTEHFETRADLFRTRIQFISYDTPLSTLDENDTSQKRPANIITTNSGGFYGTYLREKTKELVFAYEQALEGKLDSKKKVSVTYQPSDVDNLIKGILYQAAKGLGRTSAEKLISILEYRYSDDLQKDLEEVR